MNFREDLVRGIYAYGFERPSTIQQRTIKPMVTGQDVITQAQSGTVKTATISNVMLQSFDIQLRDMTSVMSFTNPRAGRTNLEGLAVL
ncbi:eukaryotic initiation factor 4A-III-like [Myzus persicae]|uniref:eukaryotic initiation factor 4A-III-like n=1 Tax=Myzus persicae TaxID=13164 RepID=UPI000B936107|nr:eukaryotic initiation factor 4A-III-like [Myzus persicae]